MPDISWNNDDRKAKSALIGTLVGVLFTAVIYSILLEYALF